jgi:hypothetical protein
MTEASDGHRTFFHHRGANALWTGAGLNFRKVNARIFHLGYLLLLDALDAPDAKFGTKAAALLHARPSRPASKPASMSSAKTATVSPASFCPRSNLSITAFSTRSRPAKRPASKSAKRTAR